MDRTRRFPTLQAGDFVEVLALIDAVERGKSPDPGILQTFSFKLDHLTDKGSERLSDDCDASTQTVVRGAMMTNPAPWFTRPRKGPATDQQMLCDFIRSLRRKLRSIGKLKPKEREALRNIFAFFSEQLPTYERS